MTNRGRAAVLVAAAAISGCSSGAATLISGGRTKASAPTCVLPPLPRAGTASGGPDLAMGGPAVQDLGGGPARGSFSIDGGDLSIAPPGPGDAATVTPTEAECTALAALNVGNGPVLQMAQQAGVALGLARVSVSDQVSTAPSPPVVVMGTGAAPRLPAPPSYRGRLAWVVVFRELLGAGCPAMGASPTTTTSAPADDYGYGAFLLDARTGTDALLYVEGGSEGCGQPGRLPPSITVPVEQVSVPWALVSRDSNGYSARISAEVLPCDGYPGVVLADQYGAGVGVVVARPLGASCGAARRVTIALHAATVTANLPGQLRHIPVGLFLPSPTPASQPPPSPGVIRSLGPADNNSTSRFRRPPVSQAGARAQD